MPRRKYSVDPSLLYGHSAQAGAMLAAARMAAIEESNETRSNQQSMTNIPSAMNDVIQNRITQQEPSVSHSRHSAFLPQSQTWTSGLAPGSSLMSSLSSSAKQPDQDLGQFPYSTGLTSPVGLSSHPTLALSQLLAASAKATTSPGRNPLSPGRMLSPPPAAMALSPSGTISPPPGDRDGAPSGQAISRALEHYSLNLLRSQLEQAQQQAQVNE